MKPIRTLSDSNQTQPSIEPLTRRERFYVIAAALLALFLGALDTLVMSAAMPTVISELGGLHLYSWVFSIYLLGRAVALPIFGKLADMYDTRKLFIYSIVLFLVSSVLAGMSYGMVQLILARALQGIASGGTFALVYIVLAEVAAPGRRGKTLSLGSFIWGLASVLGPSMGGFIVNYFSWRWIFYINLPLGGVSLVCIALYFKETRVKRAKTTIDIAGITALSTAILALLTIFLVLGKGMSWLSAPVIGLAMVTMAANVWFYFIEKRAREPVLPLKFFKAPGFSSANAAVFCASFAIFGLAGYSPLFMQGALGKTPVEIGVAMVSLSLAWSLSAFFCGQISHIWSKKRISWIGAGFIMSGGAWMSTFTPQTTLVVFGLALALAGVGMGFVSIATLLIVQESLDDSDLGVATAFQQFARSLGGTVGVGIGGSLVASHFTKSLEALTFNGLAAKIPMEIRTQLQGGAENLFRPEVQRHLAPDILNPLQSAVSQGVMSIFHIALAAGLLSCVACWLLPSAASPQKPQ